MKQMDSFRLLLALSPIIKIVLDEEDIQLVDLEGFIQIEKLIDSELRNNKCLIFPSITTNSSNINIYQKIKSLSYKVNVIKLEVIYYHRDDFNIYDFLEKFTGVNHLILKLDDNNPHTELSLSKLIKLYPDLAYLEIKCHSLTFISDVHYIQTKLKDLKVISHNPSLSFYKNISVLKLNTVHIHGCEITCPVNFTASKTTIDNCILNQQELVYDITVGTDPGLKDYFHFLNIRGISESNVSVELIYSGKQLSIDSNTSRIKIYSLGDIWFNNYLSPLCQDQIDLSNCEGKLYINDTRKFDEENLIDDYILPNLCEGRFYGINPIDYKIVENQSKMDWIFTGEYKNKLLYGGLLTKDHPERGDFNETFSIIKNYDHNEIYDHEDFPPGINLSILKRITFNIKNKDLL